MLYLLYLLVQEVYYFDQWAIAQYMKNLKFTSQVYSRVYACNFFKKKKGQKRAKYLKIWQKYTKFENILHAIVTSLCNLCLGVNILIYVPDLILILMNYIGNDHLGLIWSRIIFILPVSALPVNAWITCFLNQQNFQHHQSKFFWGSNIRPFCT